MLNKLSILLLLVVCGLSFQNCSKDDDDDDMEPTEVTYTANVKSIINNNCATCHSVGTPNEVSPFLSNYAEVKAVAQSGRLVARMNLANNPMPPSGLLSTDVRAQIDQWIADGLLE